MLVSGFRRSLRGRRSPHDPASRDPVSRPVDKALIDGVADIDVAIAIAVRAHVARRGKARPQIGLKVLQGDKRRGLPRHAGLRRVEHVGVGVDQAGQHRRLAEIDHLRARGNFNLALRPDIGDALAIEHHHLVGPHFAALAVEQLAGADRHDAGRRHALVGAAVGPVAGRRPRAAPRPALLRLERRRQRRDRDHSIERGFQC